VEPKETRMPSMSHCIIRSDGGSAGDIGRVEIDHAQVFSALNASLDDLVIGNAFGAHQAHRDQRKRLFECTILTDQIDVWFLKAPLQSS
jgi:hypothetical protein